MNPNILHEIAALNLPNEYVLLVYGVLVKQRRAMAVRKAFRLTDKLDFTTRLHVHNEQGEKIGAVWIDYTWIVSIIGWWAGGSVIVAGTRYLHYLDRENVMQGVLLIPTERHKYTVFLGSNPYRTVELSASPDTVADSIQVLNIFEAENAIVPGNIIAPRISIEVFTGNGEREITYGGGPLNDPTWINLFDTLNQTIEKLRQLYNDPEIDSFFAAGLRREIE
jgi:hypothetical protein